MRISEALEKSTLGVITFSSGGYMTVEDFFTNHHGLNFDVTEFAEVEGFIVFNGLTEYIADNKVVVNHLCKVQQQHVPLVQSVGGTRHSVVILYNTNASEALAYLACIYESSVFLKELINT